jgi:tRNA(Ile)-lysidine synthase
MTPHWLARLQAAVERRAAPLALAYSGGLDSSVLLDALAAMPAARRHGLRALHVDHRLQPASADWAAHCVTTCDTLGLRCEVLPVDVVPAGGGLEAAARDARYAALGAALRNGETLVVAQHREDQAETVLLRLLRGAGGAGLAAMQEDRRFGSGALWRPLLDATRASLRAYAQARGLRWIDDPSNLDLRHRRNHLRHRVLPALREAWPQADAALAASARLLAEDAALIGQFAATALGEARGPQPSTLQIPRLLQQPPALRRHVLRRWLAEAGLPPPPASVLQRVGPELIEAAADAEPRLAWAGAELRRYRQLLYCRRSRPPPDRDWELRWNGSAALSLPPGFGCLQLLPAGTALPAALIVRPRRGGELVQLPGRPRATLKQRLQESGMPPWERAGLPLLFEADGELLAAADRLLSERFERLLSERNLTLHWQPPADH